MVADTDRRLGLWRGENGVLALGRRRASGEGFDGGIDPPRADRIHSVLDAHLPQENVGLVLERRRQKPGAKQTIQRIVDKRRAHECICVNGGT